VRSQFVVVAPCELPEAEAVNSIKLNLLSITSNGE